MRGVGDERARDDCTVDFRRAGRGRGGVDLNLPGNETPTRSCLGTLPKCAGPVWGRVATRPASFRPGGPAGKLDFAARLAARGSAQSNPTDGNSTSATTLGDRGLAPLDGMRARGRHLRNRRSPGTNQRVDRISVVPRDNALCSCSRAPAASARSNCAWCFRPRGPAAGVRGGAANKLMLERDAGARRVAARRVVHAADAARCGLHRGRNASVAMAR